MESTGLKLHKKIRALSIAAPAYNEAEGIERVVLNWIDYLAKCPYLDEFEIVVCNDGSSDETSAILEKLASIHPCLKPVHHQKNKGGAVAIAKAISHTRFPWVILTDADGQYDIENIEDLVKAIEQSDGQSAFGARIVKDDSAFMRFGSWASSWLCNVFHNTHYRDFNCVFKLVDGSILRSFTLEAKGLNYSTEISSKLIESGIKIAEVEVRHLPRKSGRSSAQNVKAAWHRFLFVCYLGFRQFLRHQQVLRSDHD